VGSAAGSATWLICDRSRELIRVADGFRFGLETRLGKSRWHVSKCPTAEKLSLAHTMPHNTPLHLTAPGRARAHPALGGIVTRAAAGERQTLGAENRQSRTISMAENKTQPTDASVDDYIASRANAQQHADCRELMALFKRVTRQTPRMWGQHRRLWLLPVYLRKRANWGSPFGVLCHPRSRTGGLRGGRRTGAKILAV
jgi:hypothetical protein